MSKRRKRNFVRRVKRAVRTRWLSLHASVDSVFTEYIGLVHALRVLKDDPASGSMATGLLKKLDSIKFLGVLYMFKTVLPDLSALSKTFQTGAINFSRIIPGISKLKSNISKIGKDDSVMSELKKDLVGRLQGCDLAMSSTEEEQIRSNIGKYIAAMITNVDNRFPTSSVDVLDAFSIFNVEQLPPDPESTLFQFYGEKEINILMNHFFGSDLQEQEEFLGQWQSFKFHLIELRKKWLNLKDQVAANQLKLKHTATEWVLRQVVGQFQDEFGHIVTIAKTALVAPVSNAWPERGGSSIKRIKTRSRSQMKNDTLEALMMISLNGPDPNSELADKLIKTVAMRFDSSRRNKRPTAAYVFSTRSSSSVSVQTDDIRFLPSMDVVQELGLGAIDEELTSLEAHLDSSVKNVESWVAELQSELHSDEETSDEEMDADDSD